MHIYYMRLYSADTNWPIFAIFAVRFYRLAKKIERDRKYFSSIDGILC